MDADTLITWLTTWEMRAPWRETRVRLCSECLAARIDHARIMGDEWITEPAARSNECYDCLTD